MHPDDTKRPLIFATFLAPNMFATYAFIARYVGSQLAIATELVVGSSFEQFARGEVDVGFLCGLPYVQLMRRDPPPIDLLAAPILHGERYAGQPIYFSDVIVRWDSPFQSFADLRASSWAYNDPDSHSGYNLVRYHLIQLGETRGFFSRVVQAGSHQESIRRVLAGTVDASAIDSQVLGIELRAHPEWAEQLRVIEVLGPSTIQPVVAARHVPATLRAALRAVLVAMAADPAARRRLAEGMVERFIMVDDARYDDIRTMLTAAERAAFMSIM